MTPEERERMNWLVLRIQQEKDQVSSISTSVERSHRQKGRVLSDRLRKPASVEQSYLRDRSRL
jgi:hypothetical protein